MEFNIAVIGDKNVGKSAFIHKLKSNKFKKFYKNVAKEMIIINTNNGYIKINLHEIRYNLLNCLKTTNFDGIIFLYDTCTDNKMSHQFLLTNLELLIELKTPVMIIGNKSDLQNSYGTFYRTKVNKILNKIDIKSEYLISSVKTNYNIIETIHELINLITNKKLQYYP